jgi:hypothetical protein
MASDRSGSQCHDSAASLGILIANFNCQVGIEIDFPLVAKLSGKQLFCNPLQLGSIWPGVWMQ